MCGAKTVWLVTGREAGKSGQGPWNFIRRNNRAGESTPTMRDPVPDGANVTWLQMMGQKPCHGDDHARRC
jgi:hypothetical protein